MSISHSSFALILSIVVVFTLSACSASAPEVTPTTVDIPEAPMAECIAKGVSESECLEFFKTDKADEPDKAGESDKTDEFTNNDELTNKNDEPTEENFGDYSRFEHDGVTRHYRYYEPDDLPTNALLIFMLHGYGGNAAGIQSWVGLDAVADEYGFAVVYPQGVYPQGGEGLKEAPAWNAWAHPSYADDVGFLSALAQYLQAEHGLDSDRTFTAGWSNGGFMSYVLAMEAPDIFAGAASVTGAMPSTAWENRDAGAAFPLLQVSGLDDEVVSINGNLNPADRWGGVPDMGTVIEYWAERNECSISTVSNINTDARRTRHLGCNDGHEVWFIEIDNFGHEWPRNSNIAGFDGAEMLWKFFSRL